MAQKTQSKLPSIIVLDGTDATGKTTLAEELCRKFDGVIIHQTHRWKDKMFLYHTAALRRAMKHLAAGKLVVIDRLWMSEAVYGRVYRGGSSIPHEGRFVDRVLLKQAALSIICTGEPLLIEARHAELSKIRHEQYSCGIVKVAQQFEDVAKGDILWREKYKKPRDYADFVAATGGFTRFDQLVYEIEKEGKNLKDFVSVVADRVRIWQALQFKPALDPKNQNILGHLSTANYLFVGDQCNPKHRRMYWPFYEYGNCSLFLTECLHALDFDESKAMWMNVNAPSDSVEQMKELLTLKQLKVIAFGKEAGVRLRGAGISVHADIQHPQHGRRFCRKKFLESLRSVL